MLWSVRHDLGRRDVLEISGCTILDVALEVTGFTSRQTSRCATVTTYAIALAARIPVGSFGED